MNRPRYEAPKPQLINWQSPDEEPDKYPNEPEQKLILLSGGKVFIRVWYKEDGLWSEFAKSYGIGAWAYPVFENLPEKPGLQAIAEKIEQEKSGGEHDPNSYVNGWIVTGKL